ncbi:MAG: hypothetical protein ABI045_00275 [Flavobacteriales bacterium]
MFQFKLTIDHLLDEVVVTDVRVGDKTNLPKKFQKFNIRKNLVYLLDQTLSVNTVSDTGTIGSASIRSVSKAVTTNQVQGHHQRSSTQRQRI